MRKLRHVEANIAASDGKLLDPALLEQLAGASLGPDADGMVPVGVGWVQPTGQTPTPAARTHTASKSPPTPAPG